MNIETLNEFNYLFIFHNELYSIHLLEIYEKPDFNERIIHVVLLYIKKSAHNYNELIDIIKTLNNHVIHT